jgi:hypothetical protein
MGINGEISKKQPIFIDRQATSEIINLKQL